MHFFLRRLRRTEEGQALVLAAICGLILAVCVLVTVQVGHTVYQKIQLQDAADNAAFSQATMEARAMNFMAYTNRAMVVHYCSMMVWVSWISYLRSLLELVITVAAIFNLAPGMATIMQSFAQMVEKAIVKFAQVVSVVIPVLGVANMVLYMLQWAMRYTTVSRISTKPPELTHSDKDVHEIPVNGQYPGQVNGKVFQNAFDERAEKGLAESIGGPFAPDYDRDQTQLARGAIVEIANGSRHRWVADGSPNFPILGRKYDINFLILRIKKTAFTEIGMWPSKQFILGMHDEIFSDDTIKIDLNLLVIKMGVSDSVNMRSVLKVDYPAKMKEILNMGLKDISKDAAQAIDAIPGSSEEMMKDMLKEAGVSAALGGGLTSLMGLLKLKLPQIPGLAKLKQVSHMKLGDLLHVPANGGPANCTPNCIGLQQKVTRGPSCQILTTCGYQACSTIAPSDNLVYEAALKFCHIPPTPFTASVWFCMCPVRLLLDKVPGEGGTMLKSLQSLNVWAENFKKQSDKMFKSGAWSTISNLGVFLGITPYATFNPQAHWSPQPGENLGNYGQPDVLIAAGKDDTHLIFANFLNKVVYTFGSRTGFLDYGMHENGGGVVPGLTSGLNVYAAAECYYHRPGAWREMPNLFNPLWGAKLMPVAESESAFRIGLNSSPIRDLLLH